MTNHIQSFIQEVEALPSKGYKVNLCGGRIRFHKDEGIFCPLTAVYHSKTGYFLRSWHYSKAALVLGLSDRESFKIAQAADTHFQLDKFYEEVKSLEN